MKQENTLFFVFSLLLMSGCTVLTAGTGGAVSYTFTNVAYKTISSPIDEVEYANRLALLKMGIKYVESIETENGVKILAETPELKIHIDLEKITPKATQISVDAQKNVIFKDKATATAIIEETEVMLKKD
jgi:hypothetical protein